MPNKTTDEVLNEAKNVFEHVVVVGLRKNGSVDIIPTVATYQFCQWLLDRAKFELSMVEKIQIENQVQTEAHVATSTTDVGPAE